jgi:alginate O-acetyltransferase complex protein AlgI
MVFSSLTFLCVFLPVTAALYFLLPGQKAKNIWLLLASLVFYAWGESYRVVLMILCALFNWGMGLVIDHVATHRGKKALVVVAFLADLAFLGVFKYASFAVETVNQVFSLSLPDPAISLPIGISFFTFQAMSYVAEVYRGQVKAAKNFFRVLLYISLFPQLIAGPIVRYRDVEEAIDHRHTTVNGAARGLRRFLFGLGRKCLIANTLGVFVDAVFAMDASKLSLPAAWLGAIFYTLQIYFDFSGYSDMAIGLGQLFGFRFPENFDDPYASGSIREFWRKWHISLTSWFRENLYFPLGGNRKGKARTHLNRFLVFLFTGLWHGANWTFVVWGLYHWLFMTLETIFPKMTKKMGPLRYVYTMLVVVIGFVIFRADSLQQAGLMLGTMFGGAKMTAEQSIALSDALNPMVLAAGAAGCVLSLPLRKIGPAQKKPARVFSYAFALALLVVCMFSLAGGAYNPFIYFRF